MIAISSTQVYLSGELIFDHSDAKHFEHQQPKGMTLL